MTPEVQAQLAANVAWTLTTFGSVLDQSTSQMVTFDPNRVAPDLQNTILRFVADTPRDADGNKLWLDVLGPRQSGKSVTTVLALKMRTAYNNGVYSATIADNKDRAEDLFRAAMMCHMHMDDAVRAPTIPNRESRQITYQHGGKYKTLSVGGNMVGIGRAYDNLHISEPVFASGIAEAWNGILPAIINRQESCVIRECTPGPMHMPGAEWYKDECASSRMGRGRSRFVFCPYFGSLLNQRTWNPDWVLEKEEIALLEKFGPKDGNLSNPADWRHLTLENLAFRREVLNNDSEVRRNPELFLVFYPTDPVTCWQQVGGGAIPYHALERHLAGELEQWNKGDTYKRYKDTVDPVAPHVIGVDPAGWMGGDQASYQALEVWADEWVHVSEYSSNQVDPPTFAREIIKEAERLNDAFVIVENNGVGLAVCSILEMATSPSGVVLKDENGEERRYHLKNLYYHQLAGSAGNKPGIPAGAKTNAEGLTSLVDAFMDKLITKSAELLNQCISYKRDKEVAESEAWKIINPGKTQDKRRAKHHWDRVSAMVWACYMARQVPQRFKATRPENLEARREELEERAKVRGYTQRELEAMEADQRKREREHARAMRRLAKRRK